MSAETTPAIEQAYQAMRADFRKDLDPGVLGGLLTVEVGLGAALRAIDIPALLGEHWNWWFPNHVATCMCGTALDAEPGQAVYPALHKHQADLIRTAILGADS